MYGRVKQPARKQNRLPRRQAIVERFEPGACSQPVNRKDSAYSGVETSMPSFTDHLPATSPGSPRRGCARRLPPNALDESSVSRTTRGVCHPEAAACATCAPTALINGRAQRRRLAHRPARHHQVRRRDLCGRYLEVIEDCPVRPTTVRGRGHGKSWRPPRRDRLRQQNACPRPGQQLQAFLPASMGVQRNQDELDNICTTPLACSTPAARHRVRRADNQLRLRARHWPARCAGSSKLTATAWPAHLQ